MKKFMLGLVAGGALATGVWLGIARYSNAGHPRGHLITSHLSSDRLWILVEPRLGGTLVGTAPVGAPCEILEVVRLDGNRWCRVSLKGRDLIRPERVQLWKAETRDLWSVQFKATKDMPGYDGPALRRAYDALPDSDPVVGWTRMVVGE